MTTSTGLTTYNLASNINHLPGYDIQIGEVRTPENYTKAGLHSFYNLLVLCGLALGLSNDSNVADVLGIALIEQARFGFGECSQDVVNGIILEIVWVHIRAAGLEHEPGNMYSVHAPGLHCFIGGRSQLHRFYLSDW